MRIVSSMHSRERIGSTAGPADLSCAAESDTVQEVSPASAPAFSPVHHFASSAIEAWYYDIKWGGIR